jgi:protocatechuate 3,4-dioxygenase beta subunit
MASWNMSPSTQSALRVLLAFSCSSATAQEKAPARVNVMEGVVLDHQGAPVKGAAVAAARVDSGHVTGWLYYSGGNHVTAYGSDETVLLFFARRNGRGSATGSTDDAGRFRLENIREGKVHLLAAHAERGVAVLTGIPQPNLGKPVELRLAPPTFIEGRVEGLASGLAGRRWQELLHGALDFSGRWPWLVEGEGDGEAIAINPKVTIEPSGSFRCGPLPAGGTWRLSLRQFVAKRSFSAELLSLPVEVRLGETARVDVDLGQGSEVSGRVSDPDGKPLDGAEVKISFGGDAWRAHGAVTDSEGRYAVRGLPDGPAHLSVLRYAVRTGPG